MPPESSAGINSAAPRRPTAFSFASTSATDQRLGQVRVLAQRERDVLEHVHVREQGAVLKQHAHALAQREHLRAVERREILAAYDDAAASRRDLGR